VDRDRIDSGIKVIVVPLVARTGGEDDDQRERDTRVAGAQARVFLAKRGVGVISNLPGDSRG
jgi:hypothetical protein